MLSSEISTLMLNPGKEQSTFVPVDVIAGKVTLQRWKSAERLTLLHQPECPGQQRENNVSIKQRGAGLGRLLRRLVME